MDIAGLCNLLSTFRVVLLRVVLFMAELFILGGKAGGGIDMFMSVGTGVRRYGSPP